MLWYTDLRIFNKKTIKPNKWSFTKLSQIQKCPKQWQFENNFFSDDDKKIPPIVNLYTVRGSLIHLTLEKITKAFRVDNITTDVWDFFQKLNVRNKIEDYYFNEVYPQYLNNKRIDIREITSRIDFQFCHSKVYSLWGYPIEKKTDDETVHKNIQFRFGTEFTEKSDDPPLIGVIDKYSNSVVTDYKTGQKDEEKHKDQVFFYSYLLHINNKPVKKAEIKYSNKEQLSFDIDEEILNAQKDKINEQLNQINDYFNSDFPAKPEKDTCKFCYVKQMCEDYWRVQNDSTINFIDENGLELEIIYNDIEVFDLPIEDENVNTIGMIGIAKTKTLGDVNIQIPKKFLTFNSQPDKARILNAKITNKNNRKFIEAIKSSEVFWL